MGSIHALRSARSPRPGRERRSAFTFVELVIVVAILAAVAGIVIPKVGDQLAARRDARRVADIRAVQAAIERYRADKGGYPEANRNPSYGGWDPSHDGDFIPSLVAGGYLKETPLDPLNDETHHYRYYVYEAGSYGCAGAGRFYVLGIRCFETPEAAKSAGGFKCTGRDWSEEFAYVTGGGTGRD